MTKFIRNTQGPIPAQFFENEPSSGPSEFVPSYVPEEPNKEAKRDKYEPRDDVTGY